MRIRKAKIWSDFQRYSMAFRKVNGYEIPPEYFENENVWFLTNDIEDVVGGFSLIDKNDLPRSLAQIPDNRIINKYKGLCNELTGYFITDKKGSFLLTLRLVLEVIKAKKKLFIYSYEYNNRKLRRYYKRGKPTVIYIGKPVRLLGHKEEMETESIEILTKIGVIKIFLNRTFKHCNKVLWGI